MDGESSPPSAPQPPGMELEKVGGMPTLTRDFLTFAGKLLLNASMEVVMLPLGGLAFGLDVLTRRSGPRSRFYRVMRLGERWDDWLNTFRPASEVEYQSEPLGKSAATGADQLIANLESMIAAGELPKRYRGQIEAWGKMIRRPHPEGGEDPAVHPEAPSE